MSARDRLNGWSDSQRRVCSIGTRVCKYAVLYLADSGSNQPTIRLAKFRVHVEARLSFFHVICCALTGSTHSLSLFNPHFKITYVVFNAIEII
ncbi:hypothetical protein J6590_039015 [Homalodisca vitripennis]|nr:hypothetical protein J6590_039015 [Homalodisca vitripennis]